MAERKGKGERHLLVEFGIGLRVRVAASRLGRGEGLYGGVGDVERGVEGVSGVEKERE